METSKKEEPVGCQRGVVNRFCGPVTRRFLLKVFNRFCRNQHRIQIHHVSVNLYVLHHKEEEIKELIMDNHGKLNIK
jgi:hypothetical protein